ncbi:TPA: hypothetical protein HA317_00405 [Candidatus Woesearchaeota archaeon]|nr:hypothetical protein [Candidatus Woesearchaeota archaeon]
MDFCKVCGAEFDVPDDIVLCSHHDGFVHLGCCINNCSWDKRPCQHAKAVLHKME